MESELQPLETLLHVYVSKLQLFSKWFVNGKNKKYPKRKELEFYTKQKNESKIFHNITSFENINNFGVFLHFVTLQSACNVTGVTVYLCSKCSPRNAVMFTRTVIYFQSKTVILFFSCDSIYFYFATQESVSLFGIHSCFVTKKILFLSVPQNAQLRQENKPNMAFCFVEEML